MANSVGLSKLGDQLSQMCNESYEAATIKPVDDQIKVNISLDKCYAAIEDGADYNTSVEKTAQVVADSLDNKPAVDIASLSDYDQMKDKLVISVLKQLAE